jgi:hypothetical protein
MIQRTKEKSQLLNAIGDGHHRTGLSPNFCFVPSSCLFVPAEYFALLIFAEFSRVDKTLTNGSVIYIAF